MKNRRLKEVNGKNYIELKVSLRVICFFYAQDCRDSVASFLPLCKKIHPVRPRGDLAFNIWYLTFNILPIVQKMHPVITSDLKNNTFIWWLCPIITRNHLSDNLQWTGIWRTLGKGWMNINGGNIETINKVLHKTVAVFSSQSKHKVSSLLVCFSFHHFWA